MATVSDIQNTVLSGLNHIDALLDIGPDWNYLTPVGNTILYSFSVTAGNESTYTGQQAFSAAQQAAARSAMAYISGLTGIAFTETSSGTAAQVHLCNIDIAAANTTGLCSWSVTPAVQGDTLVGYDPDAYIYLDNKEWGAVNANLVAGSQGYETLLHELGHMLGLKHPFDDDIHLPLGQDNTAYTLMSYTDLDGGPYASFRQYDIAALNWLYGGDGLRGNLGINSTTGARYITGTNLGDTLSGTPFNDTLEGDGGNDMINGAEGTDTAVFRGNFANYTFTEAGGGALIVSGADGSDTLTSVEILQFTDQSVTRAQVGDTTPPAAPTLNVPKNAAGYVVDNSPFVTGIAEANSVVRVYYGTNVIGTAAADGNGFWSVSTTAFADGMNYSIYAKATDAAGNTSAASGNVTFNVDAHPPSVPTAVVTNTGGNQPSFNGTGEVGTIITLINGTTPIGQTTVAANGTWSISSKPLSNGTYDVTVSSSDQADNTTEAASHLAFSVSSSLNRLGTAGNDTLTGTAGNNAIDGLGGIDTAVYTGARSNYTVSKEILGISITDQTGANGVDSLINVERIKFDDVSLGLDVNGVGGQAYRLYQAAFDRAPDLAGLGFWIKYMDAGMTVNQAAAGFMSSPEFTALYGANPTDESFVTRLYNNVLHRAPEQSGFDFWMHWLRDEHMARAEVLGFFSESPENQAQVIGSIQNGFAFIPHA